MSEAKQIYLTVTFLEIFYRMTKFVVFLADMRRDVQEIFRLTPHEKQVMMFSATLSKEIRPVCRKFMQDVSYVFQKYKQQFGAE